MCFPMKKNADCMTSLGMPPLTEVWEAIRRILQMRMNNIFGVQMMEAVPIGNITIVAAWTICLMTCLAVFSDIDKVPVHFIPAWILTLRIPDLRISQASLRYPLKKQR